MKKLPNWVLALLVVATGTAAVAMFPANPTHRATASAPVADEVSFCHADPAFGDPAEAYVIRASSASYSSHRQHGDCLVADGTPAGDVCGRADRDHDELCDQNGDPSVSN